MRKMVVRLVIAALLLAAGEAFRRAAAVEDRLAATQEQLNTVPTSVTPAAYDAVADEIAVAARVPFVGAPMLRDLRRQRALAAYWNGDYTTVSTVAASANTQEPTADAPEDGDPELLFVAANASFRDTIQPGRARADLLKGLDDSLRRYGDVLKAEPDHDGAAYNYEFVGRLRTALARGQRADQLMPEAKPNMHGEEGDPPEGTKPPDFNVIVPMRPDERQEQFDAGVGGVTRRRG